MGKFSKYLAKFLATLYNNRPIQFCVAPLIIVVSVSLLLIFLRYNLFSFENFLLVSFLFIMGGVVLFIVAYLFKRYDIFSIRAEIFELRKHQILKVCTGVLKELNAILEDMSENPENIDNILSDLFSVAFQYMFPPVNLNEPDIYLEISGFLKWTQELSESEIPEDQRALLIKRELLTRLEKWREEIKAASSRKIEKFRRDLLE